MTAQLPKEDGYYFAMFNCFGREPEKVMVEIREGEAYLFGSDETFCPDKFGEWSNKLKFTEEKNGIVSCMTRPE
jgi:hypothetical protein